MAYWGRLCRLCDIATNERSCFICGRDLTRAPEYSPPPPVPHMFTGALTADILRTD